MPDETGAREVVAGLEFMLLGLRMELGVLGRDWFEVPGLIILLELVGGCTDRDWFGGLTVLDGVEKLRLGPELNAEELLGVRLIGGELIRPTDGELAGARLTLGGALTLGAGAGAGAGLETCRLAAELPAPELELLRSALSPKTGPQSRIKTEMSARIPILIRQTHCGLTSFRYSIADMICLLSANGSTQVIYSNY